MPPPGTYLRFKNFLHSEKTPFVIYADFECLIKPMDNCNPDPNKSYTKKCQKHEPISFSYYIECFDNSLCKQIFNDDTKRKQLKSYTKTKPEDVDAMDVFIKWLEEDVKAIANIEPKQMILRKKTKNNLIRLRIVGFVGKNWETIEYGTTAIIPVDTGDPLIITVI